MGGGRGGGAVGRTEFKAFIKPYNVFVRQDWGKVSRSN